MTSTQLSNKVFPCDFSEAAHALAFLALSIYRKHVGT